MLLRPPFLARGLLSRDPPPSPGDVLSPEVEQRCRETLRGTLLPPTASAGVLVTLCSSEGVPTFLYTLRSPQLRGRHKGDVSFPGGKRDEWDRDIVHTALREAQEELGVTLTPDVVWGAMKPLTDWVTQSGDGDRPSPGISRSPGDAVTEPQPRGGGDGDRPSPGISRSPGDAVTEPQPRGGGVAPHPPPLPRLHGLLPWVHVFPSAWPVLAHSARLPAPGV
ncbi:mitochondrial coenzyme A diphosphatase NUDT8 isoform X2 [Ascaphus truei]|uniref:mitochondrial coenzyme A diphosphatase NUDT8 isoform X2 n=1 Tax=Ascaphus truei TaxID=8439 RepID=UPI003F5A7BC6